ncbi:MAG: TonB-dependent receptor [Bacteroidales bacterium]
MKRIKLRAARTENNRKASSGSAYFLHKTFTLALLLLLASWSNTLGQTIKVTDNEHTPIANVAIFCESKTRSVITNDSGTADISHFNHDDLLHFQHPSYSAFYIRKKNIKNGLIKLSLRYYAIDESVISVHRWELNPDEIPNKIVTLSPQQVALQNPQTTADLLGATQQVYIQKSQLGGGSPMIRGFATSSVLLVVDGVRMNNAIFRSGNIQNIISIDPNTIARSEVIFGPGSVTYGSDALGGVMDFHTLQPKLSTSDSTQTHTEALVRHATATNAFTGHLHSSIGGEKWSALTSITYSDFDNLRMGSHDNEEYQQYYFATTWRGRDTTLLNPDPEVQKYSGYQQVNLMQKVRYRPDEHTNLEYGFHYSETSDIPRYDRLIQWSSDKPKYSQWYYGPQKWLLNTLQFDKKRSTPFFNELKATVAYQYFKESRHDRKYKEAIRRNRTEKLDAFSINIHFEKDLTEQQMLFYGTEYHFNSLTSTGRKNNIYTNQSEVTASRYPDGDNHYTTAAMYVGHKFTPNHKLTLLTGFRYTRIWSYSTFNNTGFYPFPFSTIQLNTGAINGSLGVVYNLRPATRLRMNLSSGFHAPNIDDLAKVFDSEPGSVIVPNPNLEPEYAYNLDMGIEQRIGQMLHIQLTGFYTRLENAMVRRDFQYNGKDTLIYDGTPSKVTALANADYARLWGMHASLEWSVNQQHKIKALMNFTEGKDSQNKPLRHVAPLFGSLRYKYATHKFQFIGYITYNGKIANKDLAPSEQSKTHMYKLNKQGLPYAPAWYTLNVKTDYKLTKNITLQVGLENLLDKRYRPYSSGIVAPGRNFIISLRGRF